MLSSHAPALRRFAFWVVEQFQKAGKETVKYKLLHCALPAHRRLSALFHLFYRHEAQDAVIAARRSPAPVAVRGRKIDRSVWAFRHVAYAPVILAQQALLADD